MHNELAEAQRVLSSLPAHLPVLEQASAAILTSLENGGKLLTCGNGGSCAEAQHLATELVGRYRSNRRSLPALYLGDASLVTCIGNDFGWEDTFSRALSGLGRPGDVLVAFTTSGCSANVVRVLEAARAQGISALAFLGKDGGQCKGAATWEVIVDSQDTARIQEAHLFLLHWLCERIEERFSA